MIITDKILDILAPFECISCQKEGSLLCDMCKFSVILPSSSQCYRCHKLTKNYSTCINCKRYKGPKYVWVTTDYEVTPKDLIKKYKFSYAKSAGKIIAELMSESLPLIESNTIVTHIPTATSRVRYRGFDQSKELAKHISQKLGLNHITLLNRVDQSRQVGSKREDRLKQMDNSLRITNEKVIKNAHVLIVDDIVTTGSTIESATKLLKSSGTKSVNAVVFARAK